jgi:hypothetical protein
VIVADYNAIRVVGDAIVAMLAAAARAGPARPGGVLTGAKFELINSKRLSEAASLETGVYLFLYRLQVSGARHQLPKRIDPATGELHLRPLPVDLFYVLTASAPTVEMQHVLLGWAMREIANNPVLPSGLLNAVHEGTFQPDETVELLHDSLSMEDLSNLWKVFKTGFETCATYVARAVPIDSDLRIAQPGPVGSRVIAGGAEYR